MKESQKPTRGRPKGRKKYDQTRTFGRVSDRDWQAIKEACDSANQSLVEWALPMMLNKARRQNKLLTTESE